MMDNKVKQKLPMDAYIYVCVRADELLSIVTVDMKIINGHAKIFVTTSF